MQERYLTRGKKTNMKKIWIEKKFTEFEDNLQRSTIKKLQNTTTAKQGTPISTNILCKY
jgi:hypothetical protein